MIDDADVGMLAQQPLRTGSVSRQGKVEPDVEIVLGGGVEEKIDVVELEDPGLRLHPVPEREGANDLEPTSANAGKVFVPYVLPRHRGTIVLDAQGEGGCRMGVKPGWGGHASRPCVHSRWNP